MFSDKTTNHITSYDTKQLFESEQGWYMFNAAWNNWRTMFLNISGDSLLDLGCGSGIGLSLAKVFNPKLSLTGIEFDMGYKSVWDSRGINVVKGDIYNLNYSDESFDTVWSSHVVEHLQDPKKMIKESLRIAKSTVIHSVPVGNVDDKNMGTKHLKVYNRLNFKELFSEINCKIRIEYVEDPYMSSFVAILDK